jgi:hypothetical protein
MFSDWMGPYKKESKGRLHVNLVRVFTVKEAHAAFCPLPSSLGHN